MSDASVLESCTHCVPKCSVSYEDDPHDVLRVASVVVEEEDLYKKADMLVSLWMRKLAWATRVS